MRAHIQSQEDNSIKHKSVLGSPENKNFGLSNKEYIVISVKPTSAGAKASFTVTSIHENK